ncbi:transcription initiation factor TFIIH subunit 4 [Pseudohyphozyma bogoriensis]|nr:transcription initiation factor TFIIH subunit 4 [Pseudohyphozyma bogoriensis]
MAGFTNGQSGHASGGSSDFSAALYSFLDKLSPSMFGRLYDAPASCLSIFRLLPPTARHIVLNVLWYEKEIRYNDVALWVKERKSDGAAGERRHLSTSLSALARLHVLTASAHSKEDKNPVLVMHPSFRENFRSALTGGGTQGSFGVISEEEEERKDVAFLDAYAETQWEGILHHMVGSDVSTRPFDGVLTLLARSELMASSIGNIRNMRITSKGFQFLLEEVNTQLWDLLLEYLEVARDVVQVLGFLFMLGSLELGKAYSTDPLSATEQAVLSDLCDYGLVWRPSARSSTFYPTRLATTLTSSAPPLVSSQHTTDERGFLIIETNYKVYAYTSNPLQIAVLNLFVHLKSRFPNFVTGQITRDSIRGGLANGITANQIIAYLTSRAHVQMRKQAALLPTTVVDQIRLWEKEGQRVTSVDGYLYDDFSSTGDFELVATYARELGVVLWELPEKRKVFVTADGHQQVREFIRRRMAAAAA